MRSAHSLACTLALLTTTGALSTLAGCASQVSAEDRPVWVSVQKGNDALDEGNYSLARTYFRDAVDKYPGEPEARVGLATAQLELGNPSAARENMEIAFSANPEDPEVLDLLARAIVESGEAAAVIALLEPRTVDSNDWRDWHLYGKYIAIAGDPDTGEQALLRAAELSAGTEIEPHYELGNLYKGIGDADAALNRYRMALWVDFRDPRVQAAIESLGHIPGPSFVLTPPEAVTPTADSSGDSAA